MVYFFYSLIHRGRSTSQSRLATARRTAVSGSDAPVIRPQNDEDEEESAEEEGKGARGGADKDDDPDEEPPSPPPSASAAVHVVVTGGRGAAHGDEEAVVVDQKDKEVREGAGTDDDPDRSPPSPPPSMSAAIHIVVTGGREGASRRPIPEGGFDPPTPPSPSTKPHDGKPHFVPNGFLLPPHPSYIGRTRSRSRSFGSGVQRGCARPASSHRRPQFLKAMAAALRSQLRHRAPPHVGAHVRTRFMQGP